MLILNERKYAERVIRTGDLGRHPTSTLWVIAKYCKANGLSKDDSRTFMTDFVRLSMPETLNTMSARISQILNKAWDIPLIEVDRLDVYAAEMQKVDSLPSRPLRRIAFTLLVLGKYAVIAKQHPAAWVNMSDAELFRMANVVASRDTRGLMLNDLYTLRMVRFGSAVDSTGIEVLFGERSGDVALKVNVMRDLGNQYEAYHCPERFRRCAVCGLPLPIRANKKTAVCCDEHTMRESKHVLQICTDCGRPFLTSRTAKTSRCFDCYEKYRRGVNKLAQNTFRTKGEENEYKCAADTSV